MTIWCDKETAVQIVESGNRVFVQGACATPTPLLEALVGRGEELHNVELTQLHTYGPTPYTDERWRGHFSLRALFVGENIREAVNAGRASYAPVFLSDVPMLFSRDGALPVHVAFIQVSPPDEHGYCSLGSSVGVAALHGQTLAERTCSLIEIAAPQFREGLESAAYELHLIRLVRLFLAFLLIVENTAHIALKMSAIF